PKVTRAADEVFNKLDQIGAGKSNLTFYAHTYQIVYKNRMTKCNLSIVTALTRVIQSSQI
ncbi:MAG TPA: hypothetical protein VMR45_00005, partial [Patescibacteria group bacterium]|nr:hypothetical protein [Patescibacteria group bacterium]